MNREEDGATWGAAHPHHAEKRIGFTALVVDNCTFRREDTMPHAISEECDCWGWFLRGQRDGRLIRRYKPPVVTEYRRVFRQAARVTNDRDNRAYYLGIARGVGR